MPWYKTGYGTDLHGFYFVVSDFLGLIRENPCQSVAQVSPI